MPTAAITSVTHIIHPALFHMRARSFTRLTFSLSAQRAAAFAAGPRSYFPASFASDDLFRISDSVDFSRTPPPAIPSSCSRSLLFVRSYYCAD